MAGLKANLGLPTSLTLIEWQPAMRSRKILEKALALIEDPATWVKGTMEEVSNGKQCYCLLGALGRASTEGEAPFGYEYEKASLKALREAVFDLNGDYSIIGFNDSPTTTHEDVIKTIQLAMQKVQA